MGETPACRSNSQTAQAIQRGDAHRAAFWHLRTAMRTRNSSLATITLRFEPLCYKARLTPK